MNQLKLKTPVILLSLPHNLLGVMLQLYAAELGFDPIETTGLFWMFSMLVLVLRMFSGNVTDKIGRRKSFIIACSFYTISYLLFAFSATMPMLYLARIVQAFGMALYVTTCYSMIGDISTDDYGKNFGAFTSYRSKGGLYGMVVCGVTLGGVSFTTGWSRMFFAYAVAGVIATIVSIKQVPETAKATEQVKEKIKLPKEKLRVLILYLVVCIANVITSVALVMYLNAKFQPRIEQIGLTFIVSMVVVAITMPYAGRMIDTVGRAKVMITSMVLCALSLVLLVLADSLLKFAVIWAGYSIAIAVLITALDAIYSKGIQDENRGMMMSWYITMSDAGAMIGSALTGVLFKMVGINASFITSAVMFCGLIATAWLYIRRHVEVAK